MRKHLHSTIDAAVCGAAVVKAYSEANDLKSHQFRRACSRDSLNDWLHELARDMKSIRNEG